MVVGENATPIEKIRNPAEEKRIKESNQTPRERCIARGGFWDEQTGQCLLQKPDVLTEAAQEQAEQTNESVVQAEEQRRLQEQERVKALTAQGQSFITDEQGNVSLVSEQDPNQARADVLRLQEGRLTAEQQAQAALFQQQGQQLAGQVGQFQSLGVGGPTPLDLEEIRNQALIGSIPRAISLAGGGAITGAVFGGKAGAAAGTAVAPGLGTTGGAAIGAAAGFVGGLASGVISNIRAQKRDVVQGQLRVLTDGKQNLQDIASLAKADPANRALYLSEFNIQLAQIEQAYEQLQLNVRSDPAKFEQAVPELAEFEFFYSPGGERNILVNEMQVSLSQPTTGEYEFLELVNRRGQ